jgi:hypothetical protein
MTDAGLTPDPWQLSLLRTPALRTLLLCSRQAGKSTATAALAIQVALLEAPALVLLVSPTQRQSGELFRDKVMRLYDALKRPVAVQQESALQLTLANGSRVVSLPGDEETIRGYSGVALLVIDEAARVADALYCALRPMLAGSGGRMVALSTPFGKRGWFFEEWEGKGDWARVRVTAEECPRISPAFLAEEQRALGPRWFRQEYGCSFEEASDAVFSYDDVMACNDDSIPPLWTEDLRRYYLEEEDPVPPQPQWPANVCRRCGLKRMLSDLDEWGMCRLCRT